MRLNNIGVKEKELWSNLPLSVTMHFKFLHKNEVVFNNKCTTTYRGTNKKKKNQIHLYFFILSWQQSENYQIIFNSSLVEHDMPCLSKQCRSRSVVIKYVNFYQKPGSSNLIGWKLEVGVASKFIQYDKG